MSEKEKTINQETPQDVMKPPANPQAPIVGKEAPKKMELVLASLAVPIQAVTPPSQGSKASDTASQQPSKDKLTIKLKNSLFPFICTTIVIFFFFLVMKLPFFVMKCVHFFQ